MTQTLREYLSEKEETLTGFGRRIGRPPETIRRYVNGRVPQSTEMRLIIVATGGAVTPNSWFRAELARFEQVAA